jgi:hypothetical protein
MDPIVAFYLRLLGPGPERRVPEVQLPPLQLSPRRQLPEPELLPSMGYRDRHGSVKIISL